MENILAVIEYILCDGILFANHGQTFRDPAIDHADTPTTINECSKFSGAVYPPKNSCGSVCVVVRVEFCPSSSRHGEYNHDCKLFHVPYSLQLAQQQKTMTKDCYSAVIRESEGRVSQSAPVFFAQAEVRTSTLCCGSSSVEFFNINKSIANPYLMLAVYLVRGSLLYTCGIYQRLTSYSQHRRSIDTSSRDRIYNRVAVESRASQSVRTSHPTRSARRETKNQKDNKIATTMRNVGRQR
jgi:hypothetical protein